MNGEELYKEYAERVYKYLLSITSGNYSLAEELTQDTMFKAITKANQYTGEANIFTYLCAIAKNAYISHLRKEKRRAKGNETDIDNISVEVDFLAGEGEKEIYKAVSMRCEGGMYGSTGIVKGKCYIGIDESLTKGIPMAVVFRYKYYEGMAYIDSIMPVADTEDEIDMDVYYELLGQMNKGVEIYNYPGERVTSALDLYLRGGRSTDTERFPTARDMAYSEASYKFYSEPFEEHSKEEQDAWNEYKAAYEDYTAERDKKINRLFSENYRYISLTGGMAEYCPEPIYEGNIFEHFQCYKQSVTISMETSSGEKFTVSFVMKCNFAAELPFENIVYSDNAPTEFRTGFEDLFGVAE